MFEMLLRFSYYAVVKAVSHSDSAVDVSEAKKGSGLRGKLNKVVLAYSGGLDTSVIVPWLRYRCYLILFLLDFCHKFTTLSLMYCCITSFLLYHLI